MTTSSLTAYNSSLITDPLRTFRFNAVFEPVASASTNSTDAAFSSKITTGWTGGFSTISGLAIQTQNITYREGGFNTTVHQIPGMTTFQPLTFTRGTIFGQDQAMVWMRGLFGASAGQGLLPGANTAVNTYDGETGSGSGFRVNVTIFVNQHPNTNAGSPTPAMGFKIHNAWITNLSYSDLDATNGALMFETMTLVHEGISAFFTNDGVSTTDGLKIASDI